MRVDIRTWATPRRVAALLAALTGIAVVLISTEVFPYHTSNHDEAVYLQQAAMLLEGQLRLYPPVEDAFRPWFFIVDGTALYPKYTPVTAALFALGGAVGSYRLALGLIGAATVALTYAVVTEVFDQRTGVVAAALLAVSPLFVVQASVFLPYVPALCLNLAFAWGYLRADRTGDGRFAALAGLAIGLSFFARPYTAVLFALPFVAHALADLRSGGLDGLVRHGTTAAIGLCGVAVTLGYNAAMTGDPLLFPYEAFAPRDGLGFGRREILGYEREYTVGLALEAHGRALWRYLTEWTAAAPIGSVLAAAGLGSLLWRRPARRDGRAIALAGLAVTITVGNLFFWGTLNTLGDLSDPADGLVTFLGPYYHVGLLVPTVALGAVGLLGALDRLRDALAGIDRAGGRVGVAALAVGALIAVPAGGGAVADPLADNYAVTQQYERAYEPFEERALGDAVVFLPDPYGPWLNHPFQALRNHPGYDEGTVYALEGREFAVADAFPDRRLYRYAYRGEWIPYAGSAVTPRLQRVREARGQRVGLSVEAGVPSYAERVEVRTASGQRGASTVAPDPGGTISLVAVVGNGSVRVRSPAFRRAVTVPLEPGEPVELTMYVDSGALGGFEYVIELPVDRTAGGYRALTPELEVCRGPRLCDGEAAYVPGTHRPGIRLNATLSTP